jgi:hypothetical protein
MFEKSVSRRQRVKPLAVARRPRPILSSQTRISLVVSRRYEIRSALLGGGRRLGFWRCHYAPLSICRSALGTPQIGPARPAVIPART